MSQVFLKNLTKRYGETEVVSNFSLQINDGEFVSFLGPSGCGKTTILRMIAGLETPYAGTIQIGDRVVSDPSSRLQIPPEKRNLGMVFQSYAIFPHLSVLENVAFPLRCRKVEKTTRLTRAAAALESVRLKDFAQRRPHQLSGGQQQRVALARALVAEPKVLLLDEPLSNLDALLREEMVEELVSLRKKFPVTMIYVTHDQKEAFRLSDRIALINQGCMEQLGTVQDLIERPTTDFAKRFIRS